MKKNLIIFNLIPAAFGLFLITTYVAEKKDPIVSIEGKNEIFKDKDFNLSVLYKQEENSVFSADKDLSHRIEKKTGNGNPENPYVFGIEINNHSDKIWTGVIKVYIWIIKSFFENSCSFTYYNKIKEIK